MSEGLQRRSNCLSPGGENAGTAVTKAVAALESCAFHKVNFQKYYTEKTFEYAKTAAENHSGNLRISRELTLYTTHSNTLDDELGKQDINQNNGNNGEQDKHINFTEVTIT